MKRAWVLLAVPALLVAAALVRKRDAHRAPEQRPFVRSSAGATVPARGAVGAEDASSTVETRPVRVPRSSTGQSADLRRRALEEEDPDLWRPALLTLAREGTPEACEVLAQAIRDPRDPAKASDAVGALARFPTESAVNAFRILLATSETHLIRLRALQGLVLMIRWTPKDSVDSAVLDQARSILSSQGLAAAGAIERDSRLAGFRHEARLVQKEIETSIR